MLRIDEGDVCEPALRKRARVLLLPGDAAVRGREDEMLAVAGHTAADDPTVVGKAASLWSWEPFYSLEAGARTWREGLAAQDEAAVARGRALVQQGNARDPTGRSATPTWRASTSPRAGSPRPPPSCARACAGTRIIPSSRASGATRRCSPRQKARTRPWPASCWPACRLCRPTLRTAGCGSAGCWPRAGSEALRQGGQAVSAVAARACTRARNQRDGPSRTPIVGGKARPPRELRANSVGGTAMGSQRGSRVASVMNLRSCVSTLARVNGPGVTAALTGAS